ncbi:LPXTG-site transpeptidase (sortase) family protein [Paenibacillus sp. yr247]|uniref:class D sortase n=1 Tax=Paenibacillus sp. yr247 TaxID=1761880 RepID=UPI00088656D4|nr:class D sortase [Paenibacillus sp. yr247]SDP23154.1 LPXTG-site transpeptidase (sortase) family protein [Paenibacillus sp. yr247]
MGRVGNTIAWSLIVSGVILLTLLAVYFMYGKWEQHRLLAVQKVIDLDFHPVSEVLPTTEILNIKNINPEPAVYKGKPIEGALIGTLDIPEIGVKAAVFEGTSSSILAKGPGHLNTSVFPGEIGTSIVAAHNITTFHRVGELKFGDEFTMDTDAGSFRFRVISFETVEVGADVYETSYPSMIIETCYPFDAVYLTDKRYLVHAALISSQLVSHEDTNHTK